MISKFLGKLKSILFKSSATPETTIKKVKKTTKSSKSPKRKSNKGEAKKIIDTLRTLPGVGDKSAKAFYEAGFKTTKSIIAADEKDLLSIPGVGVSLVNKIKKLK